MGVGSNPTSDISFFFSSFFFFVCILKDNATAGNRTPINCLEGNYANHYTTVAVSSFLSDVLCIFFSKNTLLSHLHTADISFTYSNLPLVGIIKLSESDLGEQKEYETHWCLSRGKKEKKKQMGWSYLSKPYLFSTSNRSNKVSKKQLSITQVSLHNAQIFRLLLKISVERSTHEHIAYFFWPSFTGLANLRFDFSW